MKIKRRNFETNKSSGREKSYADFIRNELIKEIRQRGFRSVWMDHKDLSNFVKERVVFK